MNAATYHPVLEDPAFLQAFTPYRIRALASASGCPLEKLQLLKQLPHVTVDFSTALLSQDLPYHAHTDAMRLQQLTQALNDPSEDTVLWALRGGYGTGRVLEFLQTMAKPAREKWFIGFSDSTALHLFLSQQWHWRSIHGCGLAQLLDTTLDPNNFLHLAAIVSGSAQALTYDQLIPCNALARTVQPLTGKLTGGNLTLVENSIGTCWQIQTRNTILFLEDTGEKGYRIDRALNHLHQAGLLKNLQAVVFGEFEDRLQDPAIAFALERFAQEIALPVYKTDAFGHGKINYPLIYNSLATIMPTKESSRYALVMPIQN